MEEFTTLTTILRHELKNDYNKLKEDYYNDSMFDSNIDYDNIDDDVFEEPIENSFEEDVFLKLTTNIKNSKYKNIFYLIIFEDIYEYIKSKQICNLKIFDYEKKMLNDLENTDLKILLNNINKNEELFLDYITIFIEYQFETTMESKIKNKTLINLTNNSKYINKFKISILDDMQYQYTKTRK